MKNKKFTIKDLNEGKCAVRNDGSLEELRELLKGYTGAGSYPLYTYKNGYWQPAMLDDSWVRDLHTQSVKDFLKWTPQRGELVEVRDDKDENWIKYTYLATIEGAEHPFICVDSAYAHEYKEGEKFRTIGWRKCRQIKEEEEVIEITIKRNGKEIDPKVLSDESWLNIKNKT